MRIYRTLALGASVLALVVSACTTGGGSSASPSGSTPASTAEKPKVTVGSAAFYESALVAEIYAQALEAKGYTVERKLNVGARDATNAALKSGELNLMPEYIGSEARELKAEATGDPAQTAANLQAALKPLGLTVLDIAPGQDQNGFVVRQETANEHDLTTMSDLAKVADQLKWGLPGECSTNPSCGQALKDSYGIDVSKLQVTKLDACSAAMAQALTSSNIDVAELCTTQPDIESFNLVLLQDDKQSQAADNMAPIVRQDLLDAAPDDLPETLNAVSAKLTTDALTKMGVAVAVDHQNAADVAKQFLQDNGLI
ncbi:MAG TPA: ABC transporter substrate-binding protein [Candidatus Limnocylindria bacterium]|nr:ABC transporter substrate-binding protein [Candidatus Limnocylindria bacterium]